MSPHARRLLTTLSVISVLATVAPTGAGAAGALSPAPGLPINTTVDRTYAIVDTVLHQGGNPRLGTVRLRLVLQQAPGQERTQATVTKVSGALRVQIDSLYHSGPGSAPVTLVTAVNSGARPSVTAATAWARSASPRPDESPVHLGRVRYSVRWADGTLSTAVFQTNTGNDVSVPEPPRNPSTDARVRDAVGTVVIKHPRSQRTESVRIGAAIRLRRDSRAVHAIQPYATISRGPGARQVQIDTIEAVGTLSGQTPGSPAALVWPWNPAARSSGTRASVSQSTALTTVDPGHSDNKRHFRVAVHYSVRWSDGTLSTGRWLSPESTFVYSFPTQ